MGIVKGAACFPEELKSKKTKTASVAYGDINKYINETTDCIYQTTPIVIASDVTIHTIKACTTLLIPVMDRFFPSNPS